MKTTSSLPITIEHYHNDDMDRAIIALILGIVFGIIFGIWFISRSENVPMINMCRQTMCVQPVYAAEITPTPTIKPNPKVELANKTRVEGEKKSWKGFVSHYSKAGCLGCSANLTMANGETLDDNRATIAFNWLPMNTQVRITNLSNGKSMVATVTDTGGFNRLNRIADLVPAVANTLETKTDQSLVLIEEL
jgi:rare lipoprotein A (peptidoglycan hydrolase)